MPTTSTLEAVSAARWRVAISLTIAMMVVYFGFILLVAFNKPLLGTSGHRRLSLGMLLGVARDPRRVAADVVLHALGEHTLRRVARTAAGAEAREPDDVVARRAERHRDHVLPAVHRAVAWHHGVGGASHADRRALLHGRPQRHGVPERPRARRRLHERRELPGHRRPGGALGVRRPDLFDRLARRLADRDVPDRRAAPEPGSLHIRRRARRTPAPDADSHRRRRLVRWR